MLDSLDIRITASADDAARALDRLCDSLRQVGQAVIPAANGINTMADSIDRIVSNNASISAVVKTLNDISSAANTLNTTSQIGNPFTGVITGLTQLQGVDLSNALTSLTTVKKALSSIGGKNGLNAGNSLLQITNGLRALNGVDLSNAITAFNAIKSAIRSIGGKSGTNASVSLAQIANGIRAFNGITIPNFGTALTDLAVGLRALGSGNIVAASQALPNLAAGLRSLNGITITADIERIAQLAHSISRFGLANMNKAIANIPALASALGALVSSLSSMPVVSDSTIRLIEALSRLNINGVNASGSITRLSASLRTYRGHARSAQKATQSLAAVIGKIYASYWLLFRLFSRFGKAINLASQLVEVQNVVDVTFGDMTDKMNEFSKSAIEALGMSELTAKQIGSKFQAMGSAMGISNEMVRSTNDFVTAATHGYADVADSIADISINLTKLAGDMASFYDIDYEDVAQKLQAIYTGQTRPLRAFGIDLSNASLSAWALRNGMEANIKTMTQAEKTLLRYEYVMANTTAAHGDFQRTITSFSNQVRIAKQYLNQFMLVLGKIGMYTFKPLVINFNKAMKRMIELATGLLNSLGKIFGWQVEWSDTGLMKDEDEGLEDIADGYDDATKAGKKFKNFLLGIDELNLLPDNSDDSGKGLGDLGDLYADMGDMDGGLNIKKIERGFDSLYDTLYKLGKKIADVMKKWLQNIDWDSVYKKARRFGKGLAQFLNGYLADAEYFYEKGRFIANGINTIANAIDAFFHEFNGWQLGVDIGSYINGFTKNLDWGVIRSAAYEMAHDIAQTINGAFVTIDWKMVGSTIANGLNTIVDFFYTLGDEINWKLVGDSIATGLNSVFSNFDFAKLGQGLSKWVKGLLDTIMAFLGKVDWEAVGDGIGKFIANVDLAGILGRLGVALWKAINGALKAYAGMFNAAPLQTALLTLFASRRFRGLLTGVFSKLMMAVSVDIGKLFSGQLFTIFNNAFMGGTGLLNITSGGNFLRDITNGLNAVSASLSVVTKAVGSLAVGVLEIMAVKDTVYDIVMGTDNLAASIVKLTGIVALAGAAFSVLLGVPAGIIVAGAAAAVGAIAGINKAMDQIRENNIISILSKDLGESSITLNQLATNFQTAADEITGSIVKMNGEHDKLVSMRSDLSGMLSGLSLIEEAAKNGSHLTADSLHELVDNLGEVKSAWEDYIKAQYDYLIQSTLNNMNFIKSQRDLTDDEAAYYISKINELTRAKYADIQASGELTDAAESAWTAYFNASQSGKVPTAEVNALYDSAISASNAMYGLAEATGLISDEKIVAINKELYGLSEAISAVSLTDVDSSDLNNYATNIKSNMDVIGEAYRNAKEEIDEYKLSQLAEGKSERDVEIQTKEYYRRLGEYASNALDSVQLSLLDRFYKVLSTGDYTEAQKYAKEVIIPFVDSFPTVFDEEGNKVEPFIKDAVYNLLGSAFDEVADYHGNVSRLEHNLRSDWRDVFWNVRDSVAPDARKSGKETVEPFGDGVKDGLNDAANEADKASKSFGKAFQGGSSMAKNAASEMSKINPAALIALQGTNNLNNALTQTAKSGQGLSTVSTGFKSIEDVVKQFSSQLPVTQSGFNALSESMKMNVSGIDIAFKKMYTDIQADGMKVLTWFKGSFASAFSDDYWRSILNGIPQAFTAAFTMAVNNAKTIWMQFAKWSNENMKMQVKGPNGQPRDVSVTFPQYEKGGFPEDGLFFANHTEMVGQFANGRTAVANNEQIVEGIRQGVYDAVSSAMQNLVVENNVELRGDAADFFTAMVQENNRSIKRTGASPLRV